MKTSNRWLVVVLVVFLAGCGVRSISDSGYRSDSDRRGPGAGNPMYRGELNEFEVLGINRDIKITEEDIRKSYEAKQLLTMKKGSSIMLIQSGAMFPDDPMVKSLEKYYTVAGFTGVPDQDSLRSASSSTSRHPSNYSLALRLAAARGGYEKIVVYWGILETAQVNLVTKTVSWVPILGWAVPDEKQRMRIRLKVAVVDVRSGQWEMFMPDAFEADAASAAYSREAVDQGQVAWLKDKGYRTLAEDIVKRFAR